MPILHSKPFIGSGYAACIIGVSCVEVGSCAHGIAAVVSVLFLRKAKGVAWPFKSVVAP